MAGAAADVDLEPEVIEVLRVDLDNGLALLRVTREGLQGEGQGKGRGSHGRRQGGSRSRTRWSFLKDLPPGLLDGSVSGLKHPPDKGDRGSSPVGRCAEQLSRADCEQQQQQQQPIQAATPNLVNDIDAGSRSPPPCTSAAAAAAAVSESDDASESPPLPAAPAASASARDAAPEPPPPSSPSSLATVPLPASAPPSNNNAKTTRTGDDEAFNDGVVSPPTLPPALRDLLEINTSNPAAQHDSHLPPGGGGGGGGGSGGTTFTGPSGAAGDDDSSSSAGLGVFCKRAMRAGDVVFEEGALLKVSREAVGPAAWRSVALVASSVADPRVSAIDLLQAVAFDGAPASVQARVLRLFSPDAAAFPPALREAWNFAFDRLYRSGALRAAATTTPTATAPRGGADGGAGLLRDSAAAANGGHSKEGSAGEVAAGRGEEGEQGQGRGRRDTGRLDPERRAALSRVMMICVANIFGEKDDAADGARALFEVACRINHSCLPNCTYDTIGGRVVVRAIADVVPGAELFVSYLSSFEIIHPTESRRLWLSEAKLFECHCRRCDAEHDICRGFRCPRCHRGTVLPPNPNPARPNQEHQRQQRGASSPSSSPHTGAALPAAGVSACSGCGLVPTAGWLRSAEVLEFSLWEYVDWLVVQEVDIGRDWGPVSRLYAAGMYLLSDHIVMWRIHEEMSHLLDLTHRPAEAAYHLHQLIVGYDRLFGRPTEYMAGLFWSLAIMLSRAGSLSTASQVARNGRIYSGSSGGRWCAYVDLVQTPSRQTVAPSASGVADADRGATPNTTAGECPACGRRHGDPSRPSPDTALGSESERGRRVGVEGDKDEEGVGATEVEEVMAWRLYLDDSQEAFRRAAGIYSTLRGQGSGDGHRDGDEDEDDDSICAEVADIRAQLREVRRIAAGRSSGPSVP